MKREFSAWNFEKYSNIKIPENLSSGSPVVPHGQTDMTNLIVAFLNFTKAPKVIFVNYKNFKMIHWTQRTYQWRSSLYMKIKFSFHNQTNIF